MKKFIALKSKRDKTKSELLIMAHKMLNNNEIHLNNGLFDNL